MLNVRPIYKMNKTHHILVLIASLIVFVAGYFYTNKGGLSDGMTFFALSIILYQAASHIKITLQIDELKKDIERLATENLNQEK